MTRNAMALVVEGRAAAQSGRGEWLRETAGLSRAELAAIVGVSAAAVSRWEAGERCPRGHNAAAYARALRAVATEVVEHA